MSNFIPEGTPGSRLSFLYKAEELLRLEHNGQILGNVFRARRNELNSICPEIADKRILWLKTYWHKVDCNKALVTPYMEEAYRVWKDFNEYQRTDYRPRVKEVQKELLKAKALCEEDDFSTHPTLDDPDTTNAFSGIFTKTFKLVENEGTNIARALRFLKTHKHLGEDNEFIQKAQEALSVAKGQCKGNTFWNVDIGRVVPSVALPDLPDPLVDWTAWTEVDGGGDLTVAANTITVDTMLRNVDDYVYDSKTIDGDFEHLLDGEITAATTSGFAGIWTIANVVNDLKGLTDANSDYLTVFFLGSGPQIYLREFDGGATYQDNYIASLNTDYYLTIARDEAIGSYGQFSCEICSDVDRTVVLDTLSILLHTSKKDYSKIFTAHSYNDNTTPSLSCSIRNLDFQEVVDGVARAVIALSIYDKHDAFKAINSRHTIV
jgi:hypothetical protein